MKIQVTLHDRYVEVEDQNVVSLSEAKDLFKDALRALTYVIPYDLGEAIYENDGE